MGQYSLHVCRRILCKAPHCCLPADIDPQAGGTGHRKLPGGWSGLKAPNRHGAGSLAPRPKLLDSFGVRGDTKKEGESVFPAYSLFFTLRP